MPWWYIQISYWRLILCELLALHGSGWRILPRGLDLEYRDKVPRRRLFLSWRLK